MLQNSLLRGYHRLYSGGYANATWIINHSVVPQLYTMVVKIKNVAGSENEPIPQAEGHSLRGAPGRWN